MEMAFYYLLLGTVFLYIRTQVNPDPKYCLISSFFLMASFVSIIASLVIAL